MNKLLRQFEKESGLEIYGLGARREKWEACMEKFTELIVAECTEINKQELSFNAFETLTNRYQEHFGIKE